MSAQVVTPAYQQRDLEVAVGLQFGYVIKEPPAKRDVVLFELLLERDGMRGDNERAFFGDGLQDARYEVGQALANTRPCLEDKRRVHGHGAGDGLCHALLLRAVLQPERLAQPTVGGENLVRQGHRRRNLRERAATFIKADHGCLERTTDGASAHG